MIGYSCDGLRWKFLIVTFCISLVGTLGLIGCGGGGGSSSPPPVNPAVNNPPVITSVAPSTAIEGVKYSYNPVATDSAGDVLTWSIANEPNGMSIVSASGSITWTPATGTKTSGAVTLTVTDGGGLSDTEIFTVAVSSAANIVPVPSPGDLSVRISAVDTSNCPASVSVLLNVLDEKGNLITDAPSIPIFEITDNGQPATVTNTAYKIYNSAVDEPLSVSLVLDVSGSLSNDEISTAENSVAGFIRGLNPNDSAEVIKFKAAVQLMQAYTTDQQALVDAVFREYDSTTGVGSVLYEAINKGLADTVPRTTGRKAVIAVSDGDTAESAADRNDVIANAIADGIPVYTIGTGTFLNSGNLSDFADRTGGIYYETKTITELFQAFQSLGDVLDEKWVVTFVPPNPDGSGHDIAVEVTTATAAGTGLKEDVLICP